LLPTKKTQTFLLDFNIFGGNSGGPVFLYETTPLYGGATHVGAIQGIIGIITQQQFIQQRSELLNEKIEKDTPLALGVAIHGSFIKDLLDQLPIPAQSKP
jgi:hypothetical protein